MLPGLKIVNRTNTIIFDSAWFAGVEYEGNLLNNGKANAENKLLLESVKRCIQHVTAMILAVCDG
jgi:hypothetical protein